MQVESPPTPLKNKKIIILNVRLPGLVDIEWIHRDPIKTVFACVY